MVSLLLSRNLGVPALCLTLGICCGPGAAPARAQPRPTFETHYKNLVVAGIDVAGDTLTLVAGKHDQDFPFFDPESKFDSILLRAGGRVLASSAEELPDLHFENYLFRDRFDVIFDGTMRDTAGGDDAEVSVRLSNLVKDPFLPRYYGMKKIIPTRLNSVPGLVYRPARLTGRPRVSYEIEIDATTHVLDSASLLGHLEEAEPDSYKGDLYHVIYDYRAVVVPGDTYFVHFRAHPLVVESDFEIWLDDMLGFTATDAFTVRMTGVIRDGNLDGFEALAVEGEDVVDLGPAELARQMSRFERDEGPAGRGLTEDFRSSR